VILEDSIGTVATTQLEDGRAVVLVASHQAPMGAITVALRKLAEQLEGAA
jgi:hypothetical protein